MLADERQNILESLNSIHISRKTIKRTFRKLADKPPRLGRFDYLEVTDEGYRVRTDVSPLLFRSALNRLSNVKKNKSLQPYNEVVMMDTVSGILMGYLCLDAYVNFLGNKLRLENWSSTIKCSLESKIVAITKSKKSTSLLKNRPDIPYKFNTKEWHLFQRTEEFIKEKKEIDEHNRQLKDKKMREIGAYAQDGSDYWAGLYTYMMFGCALWESKHGD